MSENASPRIAVVGTCEIERGRSDFQVGPGAAGVHFGCACPKLSNTCSIQELWLQRVRVCLCVRARQKERKRERVFFLFAKNVAWTHAKKGVRQLTDCLLI